MALENTLVARVPGGGIVRGTQTKTAAYTLTESDSGSVIIANAVDLVFTLPPTQNGLWYGFGVKTVSATTGLKISPNAADKIMGNGFTSADNKAAINTAATDREGDYICIVADGIDGWYIVDVVGTWAREA